MKNRKLLVIILTWNDYKNTSKCIKCALKTKKRDICFLVIDNNSTDHSIEKLLKKFNITKIKNKSYKNLNKRLYLIKNKVNLGCGLGHNTGYKFAIKNNFKYVARIDNDMEFKKNFFENNIKILQKNKNILALSPKIMYFNNPQKIWWMGCKIGNALKFQTHMRDYPYGLKDNKNLKGLKKTDSIAGCASIMKVERLKKISLSDKDFFYGPEDVEFSKRISDKKNPNSLIVNLDSKIFHKVTQSFGSSLNNRRIYFEYKYRLLLIKKIGTLFDKLLGYSTCIIKYSFYILLFFNSKHRRKIKPVGKAIVDFFIFNRLGDYDRKFNNS